MNQSSHTLADLDSIIENFEATWAEAGAVTFADFVPERTHPAYAEIVVELARVDMDFRSQVGSEFSANQYFDDYADVFAINQYRQLLQFEEARLRRSLSHPVGDKSALDSDRFEIGMNIAGFEIVSELGQGAAARIFLARQQSLANRYVVLKVTQEQTIEADRLARLQHANVVPIHSAHQVGQWHVLCMPFLGNCVLRHWVEQLHQWESVPVSTDQLLTTWRLQSDTTLLPRRIPEKNVEPGLPVPQLTPSSTEQPPTTALTSFRQVFSQRKRLPDDYLETVQLLVERLALGLSHAHEQGILHLDIKPGNILLTDDGEPMLLDFHLAVDTKRTAASDSGLGVQHVGGTLPYMSPEQLQSLIGQSNVDERADIFSLGVVFFELLTGRRPYPDHSGSLKQLIEKLGQDRRTVPKVASRNPRVSPAICAIVEKCLAPNPQHRYQEVAQLVEDLQNHRHNLPLRFAGNPSVRELAEKWRRRHPRTTSTGTLALVFTAILAMVGIGWNRRERQLADYRAHQRFSTFLQQAPVAKTGLILGDVIPGHRAESEHLARNLLRDWEIPAYNSASGPTSEALLREAQDELRLRWNRWSRESDYARLTESERALFDSRLDELLYLLGMGSDRNRVGNTQQDPNNIADVPTTESMSWRLLSLARFNSEPISPKQLSEVNRDAVLVESRPKSDIEREVGEHVDPISNKHFGTRESLLKPLALVAAGKMRIAMSLLEVRCQNNPQDIGDWLLLGETQLALHEYSQAEGSYSACIALRTDWFLPWYQRGVSRLLDRQFEKGADDFTRVLEIDPECAAALVSRALCREGAGDYHGAIADLTSAIDLGFPETRVYFLRSRVARQQGDLELAEADRKRGFDLRPTDSKSWSSRGVARLPEDPVAALSDFQMAIHFNPQEYEAYRNIAHVLSEYLKQPEEAIEALSKLLKLTEDDPLAWSGRAVLLARLGRIDQAREDFRIASEVRADPIVLYQGACVESLAMSQELSGDGDQRVETSDKEVLVERSMQLLKQSIAQMPELMATALIDPDLAALRKTSPFQDFATAWEKTR